MIEVSLEIIFSCFINLEYTYWDSFDVFVCSLTTHVLLVAMLMLNAFLFVGYIHRDEEELAAEVFTERIGAPIEGVKTESLWTIAFMRQFLFRRLIFTFTAVFIMESFLLQYQILLNMQVFVIIYLGLVQPFTERG